MVTSELIDDDDPRIKYTGVWIKDALAQAVQSSRHGAALPNLMASLTFNGTGIQVIGILDPDGGLPTTTYSVDGTQINNYTPSKSAERTFNTTFFSADGLESGSHELVITNVNGTSPNIFWLDYFLVNSTDAATTPVRTHSLTATDTSSSTSINAQSSTTSNSGSASITHTSSESGAQSVPSASANSTTLSPSTGATTSLSLNTTPLSNSTPLSAPTPQGSASPPVSSASLGPVNAELAQGGSSTHPTAVVGGVLGALLGLACIVIVILIVKIRKRGVKFVA